MKGAFKFAVIGEGLTGLALLIAPTLVGRLLLGAELTGVGVPTARVAGLALVGLSVACLPRMALVGMLTYCGLVTIYMAWLVVRGQWVGPLLWPAVALHALLTILLARAWLKKPQGERLS